MSKKAYFISAGCFILGLILGAGVTLVIGIRVAGVGVFSAEVGSLANAQREADYAYYHGGKPWAIYALSQYLAELKRAKEIGLGQMPGSFTTPFADKLGVSTGLVMTHGRLAELYDAIGQTNQSAQQVEQALKCARNLGKEFLWVTNRARLMEFDAAFGRESGGTTNTSSKTAPVIHN